MTPCTVVGCLNQHQTKGCRVGLCYTHTKRAQQGRPLDAPIRGKMCDGLTNQQRHRVRMRAKGICLRCCVRPMRPRRATCETCALQAKLHDGKVRVVRIGRGMCGMCGKRARREGRTTCARCADNQRLFEAAARDRAVEREDGTPRRLARCPVCHLIAPCNSTHRIDDYATSRRSEGEAKIAVRSKLA